MLGTHFKQYQLFLFMLIITFALWGCQFVDQTALSDEAFLKRYGLDTYSEPTTFKVKIPEDWSVEAGSVPEGLYWELVNVFSNDIGLDLTPWKGKTANVSVYSLNEGLTFSDNPGSAYPAMAVILRVEEQIVGAWMNANVVIVGPSLKKRTFSEIEGRSFDDWLMEKGVFNANVIDHDLQSKKPDEVLMAFLEAIEKGDKARATACLAVDSKLEFMMMNHDEGQLYNKSWTIDNSLVESLAGCKDVVIANFYDLDAPVAIVADITFKELIGIKFTAKLQWQQPQLNDQEDPLTYYATMKKQTNGWKLLGIGTGP